MFNHKKNKKIKIKKHFVQPFFFFFYPNRRKKIQKTKTENDQKKYFDQLSIAGSTQNLVGKHNICFLIYWPQKNSLAWQFQMGTIILFNALGQYRPEMNLESQIQIICLIPQSVILTYKWPKLEIWLNISLLLYYFSSTLIYNSYVDPELQLVV